MKSKTIYQLKKHKIFYFKNYFLWKKRLSAKVKNLKLFKYVSINELVNGTIIQEPIPMLQTNLPDTIKLVDIIDFVENEFELPQGLGKYIASFLTISEMVYDNVKAIGCSSTSKQFEISEVLNTEREYVVDIQWTLPPMG